MIRAGFAKDRAKGSTGWNLGRTRPSGVVVVDAARTGVCHIVVVGPSNGRPGDDDERLRQERNVVHPDVRGHLWRRGRSRDRWTIHREYQPVGCEPRLSARPADRAFTDEMRISFSPVRRNAFVFRNRLRGLRAELHVPLRALNSDTATLLAMTAKPATHNAGSNFIR